MECKNLVTTDRFEESACPWRGQIQCAGRAFQMASVSGEPRLRRSLSVRISSVAAVISARRKTSVSPPRLSNSMTMNSSLQSRKISTR